MTARDLPTLNALLNGTAAVLLLLGWLAVKRGQVKRHRAFMVAALVASALFLSSYVTYHYMVPGPTRYQGEGLSRYLYFTILLTHTPLATLMVPFILAAVWFAYRGRFDRHVRITRILWPTWMYVSVTGVLIYLMLYVL